MNVLIFGGTGMVGQGVLRECLASSQVSSVTTIGRTTIGQQHPKLRDLVHQDMWDYSAVESELTHFDACYFCLGISSAGMTEEKYTHLTYDLTLAAATVLSKLNPQMVFVYVSGAGTDSSEKGNSMWARVKGRTENALLRLPFKGVYLFRPGIIQPLFGVKSKTVSYRIFYSLSKPLLPLLRFAFPHSVLTTVQIGQAMIHVSTHGASKAVLETRDIKTMAELS